MGDSLLIKFAIGNLVRVLERAQNSRVLKATVKIPPNEQINSRFPDLISQGSACDPK